MFPESLWPSLELLTQEYVLVQAWKKTTAHIRRHNWYSDSLELDLATVNLPQILADLARRLQTPADWRSDPLRIVPAPKGQRWIVDRGKETWQPDKVKKTGTTLRPLAHVSLNDQVVATAVMLCLANRIETLQGDPRTQPSDRDARKGVISYGNRLYCDVHKGELRHRWGSGKLYRSYYQDYRSFLDRPEAAAKGIGSTPDVRVIEVHSDLLQFYDRVRPELLAQKLDSVARVGDDEDFFELTKRVVSWHWHRKDTDEVVSYAQQAGLDDFSSVVLPQGLVAAGFFANLVLLNFDDAVRECFGLEIAPGVQVEDASRYVDDLRIVLVADREIRLEQIETLTQTWLKDLLNATANGLEPSPEKTNAALLDGEERPLVRQSRRMTRIQKAISGGFDAVAGEEILGAVHGLIRTQRRYSESREKDQGWALSPVADVGDATVARFAAARFRTTYRSLRPLLPDQDPSSEESASETNAAVGRSREAMTQMELDDEVHAFALGLIENWIENPSNVRLLRIGLDLWPEPELLKKILKLMKPYTEKGGGRKAPHRVVWYCLAEILRAGASETGVVEDCESLPTGVDVNAYRAILADEAVRLVSLPGSTLPWYLKQQAFLFLAAHAPTKAAVAHSKAGAESKHYQRLIRFLCGDQQRMTGDEFATLAVLCRRSFCSAAKSLELCATGITTRTLKEIGSRDPSFAVELIEEKPELISKISPRFRDEFCLRPPRLGDGWVALSDLVLNRELSSGLRNEPAILDLALKLLEGWPSGASNCAITPNEVHINQLNDTSSATSVGQVRVVSSRVSPSKSIYFPPLWCTDDDRWRFQLGYLLRFVLIAKRDYTKLVLPPSWKRGRNTYSPPTSHWMQRRYGFFNGQQRLGDNWLPISDWVERLLSTLLRWPGCRTPSLFKWVDLGIPATVDRIRARLDALKHMKTSNGLWLLPLTAPDPKAKVADRPLRACIVQTIVPTPQDLSTDLTYSKTANRQRHRNHLSAALAAVERMLDLRETHDDRDGRLDWLILPELSVHPRDVRTHLVPFARNHKAIVLAGLTYEELFKGKPLVNSALWVIPIRTPEGGLQVITRRQGKQHLSALEQALNDKSPVVQSYRPCQWLVDYEWSNRKDDKPLRLSSAVCYDATDLALTTALRDHSDVFAIPALNKDVGTFDHMALALHYHMYQLVIVANNGIYGGSNAYTPLVKPFLRQVFHLHGQPQASIAFLEIDDIDAFLRRDEEARSQAPNTAGDSPRARWKFPPAQ